MRTLSWVTLLLLIPAASSAQRRLAQDTLSSSTPGVVSCGFCAGERFGVVFRDLASPLRGLEPEDFPVELDAVEIAVAAADAATGCAPSTVGGTITAPVEIYVGEELPPEEIVDLSADGVWPGETLVWGADVPLTLSVADDTGRYSVSFNTLEVRDEAGEPIRIESGVYFRVVVVIPEGGAGSSPACEAGSFLSPAGFPFRDNAGEAAEPFRGTAERSLTYALGIGWLWNSEGESPVPVIPGNWGIRLSVSTFGPGPAAPDAGAPADAGLHDGGASDAEMSMDAGEPPSDAGLSPAGGGCSCRAGAGPSAAPPILLGLLALARLRLRR